MRYFDKLSYWKDMIWLVLLGVYIVAGTAIVPFHGDESTQVYMGRDYYYHFVEGDLPKVLYDDTWSISATEQHLRLLNGTISKYVYGWIAYTQGLTVDEINEQWDWGADFTYNLNTGHIPLDTLLESTRFASTIQLVLATVCLFYFAKTITNRPTAYLTTLYFALNPNILINGRRAMMEGSHLLGMMLILIVGIWVIRERKWWQFVLLGIVGGFAVATKHPNVIILGFVFIACFSWMIFQGIRSKVNQRQSFLQMTLGLFVAGVLTIFTFYSLNPAWWGTPIESATQAILLRNELLEIQSNTFNSYGSIVERLNGFYDIVFVGQPQYFEVEAWADNETITQQIQTYESSWSGVAIGGTPLGGIVSIGLSIMGGVAFIKNSSISQTYRWFILIWGLGICIITFLLTPLPWARYYLPIYPFVGLMGAYGVFTLAQTFWTQVRR